MPSTPSFVEQFHIGIPREVTMDALEFLTPWKAPFAYYRTDTSPQDYACISFIDVIKNTETPDKILLARRSFINASTQHQNIQLALYSFRYIIKYLLYHLYLNDSFQLSDGSKAFSFIPCNVEMCPILIDNIQPIKS